MISARATSHVIAIISLVDLAAAVAAGTKLGCAVDSTLAGPVFALLTRFALLPVRIFVVLSAALTFVTWYVVRDAVLMAASCTLKH